MRRPTPNSVTVNSPAASADGGTAAAARGVGWGFAMTGGGGSTGRDSGVASGRGEVAVAGEC